MYGLSWDTSLGISSPKDPIQEEFSHTCDSGYRKKKTIIFFFLVVFCLFVLKIQCFLAEASTSSARCERKATFLFSLNLNTHTQSPKNEQICTYSPSSPKVDPSSSFPLRAGAEHPAVNTIYLDKHDTALRDASSLSLLLPKLGDTCRHLHRETGDTIINLLIRH